MILLMAVTADGITARNSNHLVDWTGKADKRYFVQTTKQAGVIIMGSRTFATIGRPLPDRLNIVMTRDKKLVSQDRNLIFTDQSPEELCRELENHGFLSAVLIGGSTLNSFFISRKLIDEIHLVVVPRFFGQGLTIFRNSMNINLELKTFKQIGEEHLLLIYRVIN